MPRPPKPNRPPPTNVVTHGWAPPGRSRDYFLRNLRQLRDSWPSLTGKLLVAEPVAPPDRLHNLVCDSHPRFHIVLSGTVRVEAGFSGSWRHEVLSAGDCWVQPPFTFERQERTGDYTLFGIVIRPDVVRVLYAAVSRPKVLLGNTPWAYHARGLELKQAVAVARLLAAIERDRHSRTRGRRQIGRLLSIVLRHLADEPPPQRDRLTTAYRSWQVAMNYLNLRAGDPIGRTRVADATGLHPNYLSALCKRFARRTFHAMLEDARLARAKWLLSSTDWKVQLVASRCGFRSANYFIRVFRRSTGCTPGHFRARSCQGGRDSS